MTKYNEIMERVEVTDEMQDRVLRNVDRHFQDSKKPAVRKLYPFLGTVAAAAVVLLVISPWNNTPPVTSSDEMLSQEAAGTYNVQEYHSVEELSAAVGFGIEDLESIPYEVRKTTYRDVNGIAEIAYDGIEDTLTYIKSEGTEDNSGDWSEYSVVKEVNVDGITVTMKGEEDIRYLAVWTDGTYFYSLLSDAGTEEEILIRLIKEIMDN